MTRVETGTDRRAGWSEGAFLGPVLPRVVLSQLVLIKLGEFVRHSSTQARRQRHQLVPLSFSQALSVREETTRSETQTNPPKQNKTLHRIECISLLQL